MLLLLRRSLRPYFKAKPEPSLSAARRRILAQQRLDRRTAQRRTQNLQQRVPRRIQLGLLQRLLSTTDPVHQINVRRREARDHPGSLKLRRCALTLRIRRRYGASKLLLVRRETKIAKRLRGRRRCLTSRQIKRTERARNVRLLAHAGQTQLAQSLSDVCTLTDIREAELV